MSSSTRHPVISCLQRRGLTPVRWNPSRRLFLPADAPESTLARLRDLWRDYGFRLLVRDLLIHSKRAGVEALQKFCSSESVERFLGELEDLGLIEQTGSGEVRCLVGDSGSFGVTLEWYLSAMLEEAFAAPALWGVRIKGLTPGDFDVLGDLGQLLYVEAKSSPPKHIHEAEIRAFLERLMGLQPDLALYFVDTHLRMKDKIVALFEVALADYELPGTGERPVIRRLHHEIFHISRRIYLLNSHRSIEENFRRCIRHSTGIRFSRVKST